MAIRLAYILVFIVVLSAPSKSGYRFNNSRVVAFLKVLLAV